jgi:hypothetical protein
MAPWMRITAIVLIVLGVLGLVGYTFMRAFRRSDDPVRLGFKWFITLLLCGGYFWYVRRGMGSASGSTTGDFGAAFVMGIGGLVLGLILATMWGAHIIHTLVSPITSMFDGGTEEAKLTPLYSQAEALRKRGKHREAIYAIHEQLGKFPNDFRGQMLLAEILAENTDDLPGAEATIHRICSQKNHGAGQIAGALNTLADWHLRIDQDVDAARAALEEIANRFPESELAHHASNRIAHLADKAMLVEARAPRTIVMKPTSDIPAHKMNAADILPAEIDPAAEAARLVDHLGQFPNDTEAREELAKIYVDHYKRLDLATEQIETLINQPTESPRRIAQWFNLLADLQIRATGDTQLAAETLHRLIERFPMQGFSEVARQRLATINLEVKRYEKDRVVKFSAS